MTNMNDGITPFDPAQDGELSGFGRVFRESRRQRLPSKRKYQIGVAAQLMADVLEGDTPTWWLKEMLAPSSSSVLKMIDGEYPHLVREGHSVSDFPNLLGDVLDRMMLDRYQEVVPGWRQFVKVGRPLRDFRQVKRLALDGGEDQYKVTPEYGPVEYAGLSETAYTYTPDLYSRGIKLSFRSIMNDDLNAFDDIPDRLGRGGRRTQSKFVTGLYVDASGPHASFFTGGNGNLLSGNPIFSVAALGTAMQTLMGRIDTDSEPIDILGVTLVVPPGLYVTAQNVLQQLTVDVTAAGGTSAQTVRVSNWLVANIKLVVDYYHPIVASTANGSTAWYVFADPDNGRPALEFSPLARFVEPALFRKMSNTARVGAGVDETMGDFESMASHFKGVIGFGGTRLDPKAAVASNGSGS